MKCVTGFKIYDIKCNKKKIISSASHTLMSRPTIHIDQFLIIFDFTVDCSI